MIVTRPDVESDGIYTIAQAAKALQVDRHTVVRWVELGLVDYSVRKIDQKKVIRGSAIIEMWQSMED